jgi:hypothetical protein
MADQRRAILQTGSNRINKLENIYLKNSIAGQRLGMTNPNINMTMIGSAQPQKIPRATSITDETSQVFRRHSSSAQKHGAFSSHKMRRINGGLQLKKQNFVEDGHNIIMQTPNLRVGGHHGARAQTNMMSNNSFTPLNANLDTSAIIGRKNNAANATMNGVPSASETDYQIVNQFGSVNHGLKPAAEGSILNISA